MTNILEFIEQHLITSLVMSMSSSVWQNDLAILQNIRRRFPGLRIAVLGDIFQEIEFARQVLPLEVTIIRHPFDPALSGYFTDGRSESLALLQSLKEGAAKLPPIEIRSPVDLPVPRQQVFLNPHQRSPFDKYRASTIVNTN